MEVAGTVDCDKRKISFECVEDVRALLLEEDLPTSALPADVVGVVDIADDAGFIEADGMTEFEVSSWNRLQGNIHRSISEGGCEIA